LPEVKWIREEPGVGLRGSVGDMSVLITSRAHEAGRLNLGPAQATGLECVIVIDDQYAATYGFHDVPRADSRGFVKHLHQSTVSRASCSSPEIGRLKSGAWPMPSRLPR
jgi:cation transport ATPase